MANTIQINFIEPQRNVFNSRAPILLCDGPSGNGKSTIAQEKMHALMMQYPGSTGVILRKTRESLKNSVILRYEHEICDREPQNVKHHKDSRHFKYANGSVLAYGGMQNEAQRDALKGIGKDGTVDFVWMEEATEFVEEDFDEVLARNRGHVTDWRQVLLTCNPDSPDHWIYQRLVLGKQARRIAWMTVDNPLYENDPNYLKNLSNLSTVYRERLFLGHWYAAQGVVYSDFRHNIHVINSFNIPKHWMRFRSIDFGYNDPSVCQWWAVNPNNNAMYMYKEIYMTELTIPEFAYMINEANGEDEIEYTVADHHKENRASLNRAGIATLPAVKDIDVGIKALSNRLRYDHETKKTNVYFIAGALVHEPDPVLKERHRPKNTIEEFSGYVWAKSLKKGITDQPVDKNNHGLDAGRYAVMSVDETKMGASVITPEDIERYMKEMEVAMEERSTAGVVIL